MVLEYKQCSNDLDMIIYRYLESFKTTTNYQNELSAPTALPIIYKPYNFRDVINLYQDKSSMDMTLNKFRLLTSTCWNDKNQPLTIEMTKDKYTGRYRLGLNSIFVPDSSPF